MILLPLEKHCSVIVCGASASGKTSFVVQCIRMRHEMFEPPHIPEKVYYFYGVHQPLFDDLEREEGVECIPGAPTVDMINDIAADGKCKMIILDDLMEQVANNHHLCKLFTEGCHHKKLCTFFLTQNLFFNGKHMKTVARNTHYFVFTKSPRNLSTVAALARQVFPTKSKAILDAYNDATQEPFGIFMLDLHPHASNKYRVRTDIFGEPLIYDIL